MLSKVFGGKWIVGRQDYYCVGVDSDISGDIVCSPESTAIHHHATLTRAQRLLRRKLIALQRKMLSFDEPERQTVFKHLILPQSDSSDESDEVQQVLQPVGAQKSSRKQKWNVDGWKRNVIKTARQTGSSYINYRGETVAEKLHQLMSHYVMRNAV